MTLNGTIEAAVSGGILMYQKAFLVPEFLSENPESSDLVSTLRKLCFEFVSSNGYYCTHRSHTKYNHAPYCVIFMP